MACKYFSHIFSVRIMEQTWRSPSSVWLSYSSWKWKESKSASHSVVSNSLWPHGLYSPWNSPSQNTGVGSLSLLQGIFPTQGFLPRIAGGFFTSWATREALNTETSALFSQNQVMQSLFLLQFSGELTFFTVFFFKMETQSTKTRQKGHGDTH